MAVIEGVDLDALNYVVKVPYNGTGATGGDPLTENLNIWYEVCSQLLVLICAQGSDEAPTER